MTTFIAKKNETERKWYVIDVTGKPVGRVAVEIVNILRGKNKPTFTPHVDTGDGVIVINAAKIKLTGNKERLKIYKRFSGYPDGLKEQKAYTVRKEHPERLLASAIKGMLPKNNLSRTLATHVRIYADDKHPHTAQNPEVLALAF